MSQLLTIRLNRYDTQPWGFRLQGGKDFGAPLIVQKVNCGSLAEQAGLLPGDAVIKINNIDVFNLRHKDAQDIVVRSGNNFDVTVQRGGSTWRPQVKLTGSIPTPSTHIDNSPMVTRTSLAHKPQEVHHIGSGYNNSARPFNSINGSDGHVKSIVNKQYNSPVGIYSEEAIAETLSAQAEVLAGGVLGVNFKKNEKVYNAANSEVLKFLQEQENEPQEPEPHARQNFFWTASHAIGGRKSPLSLNQQQLTNVKKSFDSGNINDKRIDTSLQQNTLAPEASHRPSLPQQQHIQQKQSSLSNQNAVTEESSTLCINQTQSTSSSSTNIPTCDGCGVGIVGVFVRIKDKNLHVDCFKCATCGTSLKNQGYFNLNNKLYCDIHAKLAAMNNPPPGTDGYLPVPIKPDTRLSANSISAALSAHHFRTNGSPQLIASTTSNNTYINYTTAPKPFGSSPKSPSLTGGTKSPSSYPPAQPIQSAATSATSNWSKQQQQHQSYSKAQVANSPYATLPRTGAHEKCLEEITKFNSSEEHNYEDLEVEVTTRGQTISFLWPPISDIDRCTPTASPLYIPPPETQKVVAKHIQKKDQQQQQQELQQGQSEYNQSNVQYIQQQEQHQNQIQRYWQSKSSSDLTASRPTEAESGFDSYPSTCTTTTTTSEEYQKMYQAQMQQMYNQSGSEIDYHADMEVAASQQNHENHEQNYSNLSYLSSHSGRRSAHECAGTILDTVSTYKLVDLVREVTPSPDISIQKGQKKVEFVDELKEIIDRKIQETSFEVKKEQKQIEDKDDVCRIQKIQIEQRKFQPTPEIVIEIPEPKSIPPSNIPNPIPKEWISPMVKALTTAPDKPVKINKFHHCESPCEIIKCESENRIKTETKDTKNESKEILKEKKMILEKSPPKGSFIAKVLTIVPSETMKIVSKSSEEIPLPEETEPYMPPTMDKKPYLKEDFRPKSPLLNALTTASETPYSPFGHDVISQLDDLPIPKSKLTMKDALTVAPDRCYTPLNSDNILNLSLNLDEKENQYSKTQTLKIQDQAQTNKEISCFSNQTDQQQISNTSNIIEKHQNSLTSYNSINKESQLHLLHNSSLTTNNVQKNSLIQHIDQQQNLQQKSYQACSFQSSSYKCMNQTNAQSQILMPSSTTANQQITCSEKQCQKKLQEPEQNVSYPSLTPSSTIKKTLPFGLHKPNTIPQYQKNWAILPSQRLVRTPEPQELKENVPLAFVEVPRDKSPSLQLQMTPQLLVLSTSTTTQSTSVASSNETKGSSEFKLQQPSVPVILEERVGAITMTFQSIDDQIQEDHSQTHPRALTPSLINKPAPIIPFYQTPEKLVFEECQPATSQTFDRRSVSPLPERAKSPAPGPPQNPLNAIRAPRIREENISGFRNIQTGSITTGQSYHTSRAMQQPQQGLSHYQAITEYESQVFIDKPEITKQKQVGDTTVTSREKKSFLNEEKHKELQCKTSNQIGNTQIERRQKVVEEYEHTRTESAKTVEIQKSSGNSTSVQQRNSRQQYGKTGFVANQTRRLSNLEQEISSISSQSQAISARAVNLGAGSPYKFPFFKSPEPVSKFPIKPDLPPHDEPQEQTYIVSPDTSKKLVGPPPGFQKQQQLQNQATTVLQYSSYAASSVAQPFSATQSLLTANSNQTLSASNLTSAIPVPAFKPPIGGNSDALYDKTGLQQPSNNNNTYKPTASTGPAGFKPPQSAPQVSFNKSPSCVVSDASPAGPNKSGTIGATSAPKRGRGILNKAVGPGARIPLCGCCNAQIRGPFITALGRIWCPDHFVCVNANCRRALQDIGFVEEKGDLYCEYCFEKYLAPTCSKCNNKIKGDCLNAIGKHFHPECFSCAYCGKLFGNTPFFLEEGEPYCETDWNELFTTKCFACGFPVEAGDRWVEALNHNYHSQCFNCTMCKKNLEGQSFYNKGGRPFCKNHAR